MKSPEITNYGSLNISPEILKEANEDPAVNCFKFCIEKWKGINFDDFLLKGLEVLDLASGSGYNHDFWGTWDPHFSRFCVINGADVVAIDIYPQKGIDKTMFNWASVNIVDTVLRQGGLKSLPIIQGRSFDIIHSTNFVGWNSCPELRKQLKLYDKKEYEFEEIFLQQAGEFLKDNGLMYLGDMNEKNLPVLYTKKGGNIVIL